MAGRRGTFTDEQLVAIERRDGDLLLDAGAGSGKTSVLVERFVRSVLEDGIDVGAILTITFTEKAAAELRERIRARLRELDADEAARATEGAFISTIHGFCARVLRAHALAAGLDPAFVVLDAPGRRARWPTPRSTRRSRSSPSSRAIDLIAAYGAGGLRSAILQVHDELRSRGERRPRLPALPAGARPVGGSRTRFAQAAAAAARELGAVVDPGPKVARGARPARARPPR